MKQNVYIDTLKLIHKLKEDNLEGNITINITSIIYHNIDLNQLNNTNNPDMYIFISDNLAYGGKNI